MSLLPIDFYGDLFTSRRPHPLKCDIYEKDDKYYVLVDLPGFNKNDIKISIKNGYLEINASRKDNCEDKNYLRKERRLMDVSRTFYLGRVDDDNVDASFKDGVLEIVVSKEKENKINIEVK